MQALALGLIGLLPTPQGPAPDAAFGGSLIARPDLAEHPDAPPAPPEALRSERVSIDVRVLHSLARGDHERGAAFELELFDGQTVELRPRRVVERGPESFTVAADLLGRPHGYAILSCQQGVVAGKLFDLELGLLQLRYRPGGLYELNQLDPTRGVECGSRMPQAQPAQAHTLPPPPAPESAGVPRIDLLLVYTPQARFDAGGTSAVRANIEMAVADGNLIFQNSEVDAEFNIVSMAEVQYDEGPGGMEEHLDYFTDSDDGIMDEIHIMRNAIGADCVGLITATAESDGGGVAWLYSDALFGWTFPGPFSVSGADQLWNDTLTHELGHSMGCQHDPDNNPFSGVGPPNWAVGHRFDGTNGVEYRTVMSYAPGIRIPHFSNPDVSFAGTPTGIPVVEFELFSFGVSNARRIRDTLGVVTGFKSPVPKLATTYVDFQESGWGNGTSGYPYRLLQLAYVKGIPGKDIVIRGIPLGPITEFALPFRITVDQGPLVLGE